MKFYDAFAGIGGFHLGITQAHSDWECVGGCEINKYAKKVYSNHFPKVKIDDDITKVDRLPEGTDIFCGGFPCQSFSIAGKRGGFADTRGTLFFEIARLLQVSKPKLVFLENVKGLLSHDKGRTFGTILYTLGELGYWWEYQVLNSKDFGVPQNRERVFVVGHLTGGGFNPIFPIGRKEGETSGYHKRDENPAIYFDDSVPKAKTRRGRVMEDCGTLMATPRGGVAYIDEKRFDIVFRRFTEVECERLQGFPDGWTDRIPSHQRYKCLGNAVTVNVVRAIAERMRG